MQPAISALRSREGGRNLRPLGSLSILPTLLLDSEWYCVYHLLINPGQEVRKDIYLGSKWKARTTKTESVLKAALPPLIFVKNSTCSSVCMGEKDKRLTSLPPLPQGASPVCIRRLCKCCRCQPGRLWRRLPSGSAPPLARLLVQCLEGHKRTPSFWTSIVWKNFSRWWKRPVSVPFIMAPAICGHWTLGRCGSCDRETDLSIKFLYCLLYWTVQF